MIFNSTTPTETTADSLSTSARRRRFGRVARETGEYQLFTRDAMHVWRDVVSPHRGRRSSSQTISGHREISRTRYSKGKTKKRKGEKKKNRYTCCPSSSLPARRFPSGILEIFLGFVYVFRLCHTVRKEVRRRRAYVRTFLDVITERRRRWRCASPGLTRETPRNVIFVTCVRRAVGPARGVLLRGPAITSAFAAGTTCVHRPHRKGWKTIAVPSEFTRVPRTSCSRASKDRHVGGIRPRTRFYFDSKPDGPEAHETVYLFPRNIRPFENLPIIIHGPPSCVVNIVIETQRLRYLRWRCKTVG